MAGACEVDRWKWSDPSFAFAYPADVRADFLVRFGSRPDEGKAFGLVLDWMYMRSLDCIGYEESLKWPKEAFTTLSLHVFPYDDDGWVFGGFAFEWKPRKIHAMALWHRTDPMDAARFVQRALKTETAAMVR